MPGFPSPRTIRGIRSTQHAIERSTKVRNLRAIVLLAAAIGLVAMTASAAVAAKPKPKTVAFKGAYTGKVTEKVDGTNVTALANGNGVGTAVGKGKLLGTVAATTAEPPCSPLSGTGWITGPKGKLKVTLTSTSRGCAASQEDQNNIVVSGSAKVNGGTALFRKAKGSIRFSGSYDRSSGEFSVKLTGKFTY